MSIDSTAYLQGLLNSGAAILPPGRYVITTGLRLPHDYQGGVALAGFSPAVTEIVVGANMPYAFDFDLSAGANGGCANVADIRNVTLSTAAGVTCGSPGRITYGDIPSSESNPGSSLHNVRVKAGDGGGFQSGFMLGNAWHMSIKSVYGFGGLSREAPLLDFTGMTVNMTIDDIQGDFWRSLIRVTNPPGKTFQGLVISNLLYVQCPYGALELIGTPGDDCGAIVVNGVLADNGNDHSQGVGLAIRASYVNDLDIANLYAVSSCVDSTVGRFDNCRGITLNAGKVLCGNGPQAAGLVFDNCEVPIVQNVTFIGWQHEVAFVSGTYNHQMHGCRAIGKAFEACTPLDAGAQGCVGDVRSFGGVVTLVGGHPSESFPFDVTACGLGKPPGGAAVSVTSDPWHEAQYDGVGAFNSPTTITVRVWRKDGQPTNAGNLVGLSVLVGP